MKLNKTTIIAIIAAGGLLAFICFMMGAKHSIADEDRVKGAVLKAEG